MIGVFILLPLMRGLLKAGPSTAIVYVGLIGMCLVGLPAMAGLLAIYAQRRALRLDAEGITALVPFSRRRVPYAAVVRLTSYTHLSGTSAQRRHYTLYGEDGAAVFSWDWPDPAPPAAQDALFILLIRLQKGAGKPITVEDKAQS